MPASQRSRGHQRLRRAAEEAEQDGEKQSAQEHFHGDKVQCQRDDMEQLEQPYRSRQRNWVDSGKKMHSALGVPFDLPAKLGMERGKRRHFGLFFSNFNLKRKVNFRGERRSVMENTNVRDTLSYSAGGIPFLFDRTTR